MTGLVAGRFELHAHTTASDGVLTPSALVEYAAARGLAALAITDHDTLRGIPEAAARGRELGIEVIPGIEATCEAACESGTGTGAGTITITSTSTSTTEVHILGLFVDPASRALAEAFARLRQRRLERMHEMIQKLRALGIEVERYEEREGASVGRPHLARALVARGAVASVDEAFRRYLAEGRPAYVEKAMLPSREGIAAIRAAGGVAVLAHPGRYKAAPDLDRLAREGLQGLEVHYPTHTVAEKARFTAEAARLGLIVTGGADFHGDPGRTPDLGAEPVPADALDRVRAAARA